MDADEVADVNDQLVASVGTCSVMGTASTMACIAEALGMTVPGGASPPAVTADRIRIAEQTGARAVQMAKERLTIDKVLTPDAFENALRVLLAIGVGTAAGGPMPSDSADLPDPYHRDHIGRVVISRLAEEDLRRAAEATGDTIISVSGAPVRASDGAIRLAVIVARDVTQLRELQRQKDEFLAMLAHELRNPLSPILTALELMRRRAPGLLERERTLIERQVHHVVRLVDDLLDVSRITRGKIELKRRPVEMGDVVTAAIEMASPLIEGRRHRVEVDVSRRGLLVDGDSARLAQVLHV